MALKKLVIVIGSGGIVSGKQWPEAILGNWTIREQTSVKFESKYNSVLEQKKMGGGGGGGWDYVICKVMAYVHLSCDWWHMAK